jgi:hypothetical protein
VGPCASTQAPDAALGRSFGLRLLRENGEGENEMKELRAGVCVNPDLLHCSMLGDRALVVIERWRRWADFDDAVIIGVFWESLQFLTAEDLQDDE